MKKYYHSIIVQAEFSFKESLCQFLLMKINVNIHILPFANLIVWEMFGSHLNIFH